MDRRVKLTEMNSNTEYCEYLANSINSYIIEFLALEDNIKKCKSIKYFLQEDTWHIDELKKFELLKRQCENNKYDNSTISFNSENICVKLEVKYVVLKKLLSTEWGIESLFNKNKYILNHIFRFIEQNYPNLDSIIDIDIDVASKCWTDWLKGKSIKIETSNYIKWLGKKSIYTNGKGNFLKNIYDYLFKLIDCREEWCKEKWDVRNLKQYGVLYNNSQGKYYIDFSDIKSEKMKEEIKRYYKDRLLGAEKASWTTILNTHRYLIKFLSYIHEIEPSWDDLCKLTTEHVNQYLNYISIHSKNELHHDQVNSSLYVSKSLAYIKKFLMDIYDEEYKISPEIDVKKLLSNLYKPKIVMNEYKNVDYVQNFVLDQFIKHFKNLHKEVQPIVYIMLMTGLGITDTLCIKQDCLLYIEGTCFLQINQKYNNENIHKVPIDSNLALIIKKAINDSKAVSTEENNPDKYVFCRYKGIRRGKPYNSSWVLNQLNKFAQENKIVNEKGEIFHFTSEQFKHTYAIQLLGKEMDILKLRNLPQKTSASMAMRYILALNNEI